MEEDSPPPIPFVVDRPFYFFKDQSTSIRLLRSKKSVHVVVLRWAATDIADPNNPVGAKGVGEPVMGCATAALLCAISDALGGHYFNRTPIVRDMIVNAAMQRSQSYEPLAANSQ